MRENSLGSTKSLSLSFDSDHFEEKNAETDDETDNLHKYDKIGYLTDLGDIKESMCVKHYDENGNKYYNDYKFVSFLGSGAFSKIELVEKDGVKYALKIIDKSFLKSQKNMEFDEEGNIIVNTHLENALKEIAILKKMNHPNIIRLYEILYSDKNQKIYLILEHCEHGDLIEYDEEEGKFILNKNITDNERKGKNKEYLSTKLLLKFLIDIISGLCYLHSNGIIHRDIKPNNILLDKDNNCKITDFNVSSILTNVDDDKIGKKVCSADHFRPPEACNLGEKNENENEIDNDNVPDLRGKPIDIWALGVTAYILSYNKFPFESENNNIFELYEKIGKCEYEFPKYPRRRPIIKHLIKRCLEKDPSKRITVEGLYKLPFLKKDCSENLFKWRGFKKINISKQDLINSVNFLVPDCVAIFKNMGHCIKKKINTQILKYKKFKGKIHHLRKNDCFQSIEEKYGVFVVDGMIFRNEDFGIPDKHRQHKHHKLMKKKCFENYKKYKLEKEKQAEESIKRKSFQKFKLFKKENFK
jgi:[calcium/calmodulin-dependent protein kinase] kinase